VEPYLDDADIPAWAAPAVAEATALGLLRGRPDGTFAPSDPFTAGEMVLVLERLLNYCGNYYVAVSIDKGAAEIVEGAEIVEKSDLTTTAGAGVVSRRRTELPE
jgi:hypothetical protein